MQKIDFSENLSLKNFEKHALDEMKIVVEFFEKELSKLRTNRAHPSLIEDVIVQVYGQTMPLKNVAVITVSDAHTFVIQPFDVNTINDIERGISQNTYLGASPRNDGQTIKIILPPMSQARRLDLVKTVKNKHEEALIGIRKIRQEVLTLVKDAEKAKKISEDLCKRLQKQLQTTVDSVTEKITALQHAKEASLKD